MICISPTKSFFLVPLKEPVVACNSLNNEFLQGLNFWHSNQGPSHCPLGHIKND